MSAPGTPQGGYWYAAAVHNSELPPPARLLALVLSGIADSTTGRVALSLTTLSRFTGLGRSTVGRSLNMLEREGWVRRARPEKYSAIRDHATTEYTVVIPCSYPTKASPRAALAPSARAGLGLVPETQKASARAGHRTTSSNQRSASGAGAPAVDAGEMPRARGVEAHTYAPDSGGECTKCSLPPAHPIHGEVAS